IGVGGVVLIPLRFLLLGVGLWAKPEGGEWGVTGKDTWVSAQTPSFELVNESTKTRQSIDLPADGRYSFKNLPFGVYRLRVSRSGFVTSSELIEIRSALPQARELVLGIEAVETAINVNESETLLDPHRAGNAHYVGSDEIKEHAASLAGRGLLDLVGMQPGWTFEANGILHPRESEYDTQFVVNGFPVYDNRSPAFAPTVDA